MVGFLYHYKSILAFFMIIILFFNKKRKRTKNLNILKCVLVDNLIHQGTKQKTSNKEWKKVDSHAQVISIDLTEKKILKKKNIANIIY